MNHPMPPLTDVQRHVAAALAEDLGSGDITAQLIPEAAQISAKVIARETAILCGQQWAAEVFRQVDQTTRLQWLASDGDTIVENEAILHIVGNARSILSAERCALNFLQTLSATATETSRYVKMVSHTQVRILDTRKTLPGLRSAQKYAVTVGGGTNHRMGLFDAYLIKENHIAACGGIAEAIASARRLNPEKAVEIEVRNLDELAQALAAKPNTIMLDNFPIEALSKAVEINSGRCILEASGGVSMETLVSIAETGVDCISVGALTKHCRAVDLSLLIE